MTALEKAARNALDEIIYTESFGWPPVCSTVLYQPERPVRAKITPEKKDPEKK